MRRQTGFKCKEVGEWVVIGWQKFAVGGIGGEVFVQSDFACSAEQSCVQAGGAGCVVVRLRRSGLSGL